MKEIVLACGRVFDVVCKIAVAVGGTGLVLMTVFIAWQVYGRFILNDTPTWTEPTALLLMLYFILLVAAVGVRERFHLGLDLFRMLVPPKVNLALDIVSFGVVGFLGFAMMIYGLDLCIGTWQEQIPAIFLPEGVRFLPMFFAGLMIGVFSIERIVRLLLGIDHVSSEMSVGRD